MSRMSRGRRTTAGLLAAAAALALPATPAAAYESDVHFGLTKWLALQAGFDESQASAIALGNQRQDGGLMDTMAVSLEYACSGHVADVAREVQQRHYPALQPVPAPPEARAVEAGGAAARRLLGQMAGRLGGKEGLMLGKFGEALHTLQDSWSHQGVASVPQLPALACDAMLASMPAVSRGGAASHAADLTRSAPDDATAMAKATYEALVGYPAVAGRARRPAAWGTLAPAVEAFARLSTKTAKREWFVQHGVEDTSFLAGISLPDGRAPGALAWAGRKLPELSDSRSGQHDAPAAVRAFFDELLARWLGSNEPVDAVVAALGPPQGSSRRELGARLKLLKWRDHGSAAALVHAGSPLTQAQMERAERMARDIRGFVQVPDVAAAVFPLQPIEPAGAPLVPYIVRAVASAEDGGRPRMVAMLRLRHAPYDSVGLVAEWRERWVLVEVVAAVDP